MLAEFEARVERGQQVFKTHVEARLRDREAEVEARAANTKDALAKDYRGKLAKAEARYKVKLDEAAREKGQIKGRRSTPFRR